MDNLFLTPKEIAEKTVAAGKMKTSLSTVKMLILGILSGIFIALGAEGSNLAACHLLASPDSFFLGKTIAGVVFGAGLMMVVLAGAELFTGNSLIFMGVLDGEVKASAMLKNWLFVYIGNFIGGIFTALIVVNSGQLKAGGAELGGMTIKIAAGKVGGSFFCFLLLGVLCNFLVCLAVWMATAAKDIGGKLWAIFFPIMLFVISGFEHSVANMYYIPAGIFAKAVPAYLKAAMDLGLTEEQISSLNWVTLFTGNLIPVTIGNVLGGTLLVALPLWIAYRRKEAK